MAINSRNGNTLLDGGFFAPVRAASTAALTLSALQTVDGIALAEGDRVLVKDQADATTNGIYAASTGNWVRTTDAASNTDFFSGMAVVVALGTVSAGQVYYCTCTDDPVVIGTSSLTFALQSTVQTAQQSATSTTSAALTTGAKTFTTQSGKNFTAKQWLLIYETANPDNNLLAEITSYSGTSLVVNVAATAGSGGPFTDWSIVLNNSAAAAGRSPPIGTGNVSGPGSAVDGHAVAFDGTTGKIIKDGGALGSLAALSSLTAQYLASSAIAFGIGMLNGTIVESHAGGALTVAIKTLAGTDPSATDPTYFLFRDVTAATGDYVVRTVTAALSVTISSGSTLGFSNSTAGRLWLCAFDDGGTVRLGLINCYSGGSIYPLGGFHIASTTADDGAGGSDLAQVFYTPNAHALTSKAFVIAGYLSWESGLAAAGTWDASPTRIQLYGPGTKLPGDIVQTAFNSTTTSGSTASAAFVTLTSSQSLSITPTSAANPIRAKANGTIDLTLSGSAYLQIQRGIALIGNPVGIGSGSSTIFSPCQITAIDFPNSASSQTYSFQGKVASGGGTLAYPLTGTGATLTLDEIMS